MTDFKDGLPIEPKNDTFTPENQVLKPQEDSKEESSKTFSMETIMKDLEKPKQVSKATINYDEDEDDDDEDNGEDEPNKDTKKPNPSENAQKNAEIIGKAIDRLGAFGLSLYAKEENSDYFRMKTSELKMLTEEMESTFAEAPDFKMPPYIGLLIVLPVIYMPIIKRAKDLRKTNEAKAKFNSKNSESKRSSADIISSKNTNIVKNEIQDAEVIYEEDFDKKKREILNREGICEADGCQNPKNKDKKYCSRSCSATQTNKIRWGKIPKRD